MEILLITLFTALCLGHSTSQLVKSLAVKKYTPNVSADTPEISVLVSAHNEYSNLKELLPLLCEQDYQSFEVIILLDRCTDSSNELITKFESETTRFIQISQVPQNFHPKKFAINKGIAAASGEWILLTDADCRPKSGWISEMAKHMTDEIVIGLSPYERGAGFLSQLIQFETYQTALHFTSSAINKKPYMALGRNLAYKKSLFQSVDGFGSSQQVLGGDDDLLIQRMITADNYSIAFSKGSIVDSIPMKNWLGYFRQKTRHLSVGTHYPNWAKRLETFRWSLHTGMWFFFIPSLIVSPFLTSLILLLTFILKAISINIVAGRLEKRFNHLMLPFVDLTYAVFVPLVGLRSLLVKNIKWN